MKKILFTLVLAIMTMAVPMEAQKMQWMTNSGMTTTHGTE